MLSRRLLTSQLPALQRCTRSRAFTSATVVRFSQPSAPVRNDSLPSFQPHPKDAAAPATSTSSTPSTTLTTATKRDEPRPFEDWTLMHPVYSPVELDAVKVVRHKTETVTDRMAAGMVKFARWGFDFVTGYKHASPEEAIKELKKAGKTDLSLEVLRKEGYLMTPQQWLHRILFLESIAGVPGFTAGILRHLRSLRLMKRDNGWINSLLAEAENERMHLMTFLKVKNPTSFFRLLVILTQGVFFNAFFLLYMLSPKAAHRFVGCLEEEACLTYTQILSEIDRGHLPEWESEPVPQIAIDYWRLEPDKATFRDLILNVRADEAGHRFLNHTLANLSKDDLNPYAFKHPTAQMQGELPGVSREEGLKWAEKVKEEVLQGLKTSEKSASENGKGL